MMKAAYRTYFNSFIGEILEIEISNNGNEEIGSTIKLERKKTGEVIEGKIIGDSLIILNKKDLGNKLKFKGESYTLSKNKDEEGNSIYLKNSLIIKSNQEKKEITKNQSKEKVLKDEVLESQFQEKFVKTNFYKTLTSPKGLTPPSAFGITHTLLSHMIGSKCDTKDCDETVLQQYFNPHNRTIGANMSAEDVQKHFNREMKPLAKKIILALAEKISGQDSFNKRQGMKDVEYRGDNYKLQYNIFKNDIIRLNEGDITAVFDKYIDKTKVEVTPSVKKDEVTPSVKKDEVTPSVKKDEVTPSVKKDEVTPSVKKDEVTPSVKKDEVTPSVKKDEVTPSVKKDEVTPSVKKDEVTPSVKKDEVTPSVKKDEVTPSVKKDEVTPSVKKDEVTPSAPKTKDKSQYEKKLDDRMNTLFAGDKKNEAILPGNASSDDRMNKNSYIESGNAIITYASTLQDPYNAQKKILIEQGEKLKKEGEKIKPVNTSKQSEDIAKLWNGKDGFLGIDFLGGKKGLNEIISKYIGETAKDAGKDMDVALGKSKGELIGEKNNYDGIEKNIANNNTAIQKNNSEYAQLVGNKNFADLTKVDIGKAKGTIENTIVLQESNKKLDNDKIQKIQSIGDKESGYYAGHIDFINILKNPIEKQITRLNDGKEKILSRTDILLSQYKDLKSKFDTIVATNSYNETSISIRGKSINLSGLEGSFKVTFIKDLLLKQSKEVAKELSFYTSELNGGSEKYEDKITTIMPTLTKKDLKLDDSTGTEKINKKLEVLNTQKKQLEESKTNITLAKDYIGKKAQLEIDIIKYTRALEQLSQDLPKYKEQNALFIELNGQSSNEADTTKKSEIGDKINELHRDANEPTMNKAITDNYSILKDLGSVGTNLVTITSNKIVDFNPTMFGNCGIDELGDCKITKEKNNITDLSKQLENKTLVFDLINPSNKNILDLAGEIANNKDTKSSEQKIMELYNKLKIEEKKEVKEENINELPGVPLAAPNLLENLKK